MLKIRRSRDRLILNMAIPIPGKMVFILRRGPGDITSPHRMWSPLVQMMIRCVITNHNLNQYWLTIIKMTLLKLLPDLLWGKKWTNLWRQPTRLLLCLHRTQWIVNLILICVAKSYSISVELFSQKILQNQFILAKPNDHNSVPDVKGHKALNDGSPSDIHITWQ